MPKPYEKYVLNNGLAVAAIYEPHPFRNIAIKKAVEKSCRNYGDNNTGIEDIADYLNEDAECVWSEV